MKTYITRLFITFIIFITTCIFAIYIVFPLMSDVVFPWMSDVVFPWVNDILNKIWNMIWGKNDIQNKRIDIQPYDYKSYEIILTKGSQPYYNKGYGINEISLEKEKEIYNKLLKSIKELEQSTKESKDKESGEPRDIRSPLDQFSVIDFILIWLPILGAIELSFTNMTLNIGISTSTYSGINILPLLWEKVVTSKWFTSIVSLYHTVFNLVKSQINVILNNNFLPFFLCLFVYVLTNNLVGMIPYTLAPTSHFILTFFISFSLVIGVTILGFMIHKLFFFSLLVPSGCPLGLLPLLVLIETISYLARSVSLGLRLAANILSGHMLLNILSEFTYKIMNTNTIYLFLAMIPLMFIGGFSGLELGIAFIQSQVFVVLGSSYTKDAVQLH